MKSTSALLLVALAAFVGVAKCQTPTAAQLASYAALCATPTTHTMIKYPGTGPACAPLVASGVPLADQTIIVNAHNDARSKVALGLELRGLPGPQPAAANMRKLVWDAELAMIAQRYALQCTWAHDLCRDVARFKSGQNLYIYMSTSAAAATPANWASAVVAWVNEVINFSKLSVASYTSPAATAPVTGHYTAVVWANTSTVGCGRAVFRDALNPTYTKNMYVCNYGAAGNVISLPVYKTGPACSQCATAGCVPAIGLCP